MSKKLSIGAAITENECGGQFPKGQVLFIIEFEPKQEFDVRIGASDDLALWDYSGGVTLVPNDSDVWILNSKGTYFSIPKCCLILRNFTDCEIFLSEDDLNKRLSHLYGFEEDELGGAYIIDLETLEMEVGGSKSLIVECMETKVYSNIFDFVSKYE